jgi:hypothetical protein
MGIRFRESENSGFRKGAAEIEGPGVREVGSREETLPVF